MAEELHFGRAATHLNVSQPPLSRQIRQLEEELGVKLLHRTKREVRLTDAGARILNEAHHVMSDVDHLTRAAARASGGGIGQLSIGVPGGLNEIPIQALRAFAKQCPGVRIEFKHMNTGTQIESIRQGSLHVGFLNLPVRETGFTLETLKKGPLWIALPNGHPAARYDRVPLKTLKEEDIVFRPVQSSVEMRYAVAYRRDQHSPVLDRFLKIVRQVARDERDE